MSKGEQDIVEDASFRLGIKAAIWRMKTCQERYLQCEQHEQASVCELLAEDMELILRLGIGEMVNNARQHDLERGLEPQPWPPAQER